MSDYFEQMKTRPGFIEEDLKSTLREEFRDSEKFAVSAAHQEGDQYLVIGAIDKNTGALSRIRRRIAKALTVRQGMVRAGEMDEAHWAYSVRVSRKTSLE